MGVEGGGWVGGWVIDVPCDGYGIYMFVLRSAERFPCRFDVALRLFVVSELSDEHRRVSED